MPPAPPALQTSQDISWSHGAELGMTLDRQEDIRKAIYNVFGGAGGSGSGKGVTPGSSGGVSAGAESAISNPANKEMASNSVSNGNDSRPPPADSSAGAAVLQAVDDREDDIGVPCAVCTLLNSPNERFCLACNHPLE